MTDWTLSEAERKQYEDEGFFARPSVFGAADLERFRVAVWRQDHW